MRSESLKKIFLRNPEDWKVWLGYAFIFKVLIFIFELSEIESASLPGFIGVLTNDSNSYLDPVIQLINQGNYDPDYRMPGYAVLAFPLMLLFSKAMACNFIVMIQVVLAALSVYCLALFAKSCFKSDTLFYLTFYSFGLSTYSNLFDHYILSESICTSSLIFSSFYFSKYFENRNGKSLVYAGVFLTWAIFLRPVYAPLFLIFIIVLIYDGWLSKSSLRKIGSAILIFFLPFLIVDGSWLMRNYWRHGEITILSRSFYYPELEDTYVVDLIDFVKAWGGDRTWWNPDAEIRWFGLGAYINRDIVSAENVVLPSGIYTSCYTIDSLKKIRSSVIQIEQHQLSPEEKALLTTAIRTRLQHYTECLRQEKPFLYYVKAPLILLKKFLVHSGTYNLFSKPYTELTRLELFIKVVYSSFYLATLFLGFAGLVILVFGKKMQPVTLTLAGLVVYATFIFPLVLRQIEFRYFVPVYPFITVTACYFLLICKQRLQSKFSS